MDLFYLFLWSLHILKLKSLDWVFFLHVLQCQLVGVMVRFRQVLTYEDRIKIGKCVVEPVICWGVSHSNRRYIVHILLIVVSAVVIVHGGICLRSTGLKEFCLTNWNSFVLDRLGCYLHYWRRNLTLAILFIHLVIVILDIYLIIDIPILVNMINEVLTVRV